MRFFLGIFLLISSLAVGQDFEIREQKEIAGFENYVYHAKFSPFRNYFAVSTGNNEIFLYDKDWKVIWSYKGNKEHHASDITFSPDEKQLIFTRYRTDHDLAIFDIESRNISQFFNEHTYLLNAMQISNNGDFLATGGSDYALKIWKNNHGSWDLHQNIVDHTESVKSVAFNQKGNLLATADNDGIVRLFELIGNEYQLKIEKKVTRSYLYHVCFHPTEDYLISSSSNHHYTLAIKDQDLVKIDSLGIRSQLHSISFSPDGQYFFTTNRNGFIFVYEWQRQAFMLVKEINRHNLACYYAHCSGDGEFLATTGDEGKVVIWKLGGVQSSNVNKLQKYLGKPIPTSLYPHLSESTAKDLIAKLPASMKRKRDEFEKANAFEKRQKELNDRTLAVIQEYLEMKHTSGSNEISSFELIGYNPDQEIYKTRIMNTPAGVRIPLGKALSLKKESSKASVSFQKSKGTGKSLKYDNYTLKHGGAKYEVFFNENPFWGKEDKINNNDIGITSSTSPSTDSAGNYLGKTYALIIATNEYAELNDLVNPVLDAEAIQEELESEYGVEVKTLKNPTLEDIISYLRGFAQISYKPEDQLLIFVAGHGQYDEIFGDGFIASSDSKKIDPSKISYLSHSRFRDMINNIDCNHIMVMLDVCFGGTFDDRVAHRGDESLYEEISKAEFVKRKKKYKTRLYLTSGGKEYVPDGRPGQHSPFARKVLEALRVGGGNDRILTVGELTQFVEKVKPEPHFGEFGDNEPGSDFLLIRN